MERVIYADVYFTVNFSMDFLSLFVCARMLHLKARALRLSFASAIGALFALLSLLLTELPLLSLALSIAVAFIMCSVAFGLSPIRTSIYRTASFMGVSALLAGLLSALFSALNRFRESRGIYVNGTVKELYSDIPVHIFYLLAGLSALGAALWVGLGKRRAATRRAEISVSFGSNSAHFSALSDSGDFLCDPISSLPVIVVSRRVMKKLLPPELFTLCCSPSLTEAYAALSLKSALRVRLINVKSATGSSLLAAFSPDSLTLDGKKRDALLCCPGKEESFEGADGIVPEFML